MQNVHEIYEFNHEVTRFHSSILAPKQQRDAAILVGALLFLETSDNIFDPVYALG